MKIIYFFLFLMLFAIPQYSWAETGNKGVGIVYSIGTGEQGGTTRLQSSMCGLNSHCFGINFGVADSDRSVFPMLTAGVEIAGYFNNIQISVQPFAGFNHQSWSQGAAFSMAQRFHSKDGGVSVDFGPFALVERIKEDKINSRGRKVGTIWGNAAYIGFKAAMNINY